MTALSDLELAVLAFERRFFRHAGAKDQAILDELSLSATRYYQLLRHLTTRPEAQEHAPDVINRQIRLQQQRQRARRAG